jgi:hypothetical protein
MSGEAEVLADESAATFIRALVNAWDCCATCAGGVLLRSDWLRAHDDRIRAEAIKSAADNLPLSGKGQQYAGAAAWLYRRAALRAAAGTPTRHNQKEENMSETAQVCDHPGIEHGAWSYTWPCPRCGVCRFIGHGPLCGKCYHETAPVPPVAEGKA